MPTDEFIKIKVYLSDGSEGQDETEFVAACDRPVLLGRHSTYSISRWCYGSNRVKQNDLTHVKSHNPIGLEL